MKGVVEHVLARRKRTVAAGEQLELVTSQNGRQKRELHINPTATHIGNGAARPAICPGDANDGALNVQVRRRGVAEVAICV